MCEELNVFDKSGFIEYLQSNFNGFNGTDGYYLRELVSNLVEYGCEHKIHTLDSFVYFMKDILPEIEFGEIAMYMDDKYLTKYGREEKKEWLEKTKGEKCRINS